MCVCALGAEQLGRPVKEPQCSQAPRGAAWCVVCGSVCADARSDLDFCLSLPDTFHFRTGTRSYKGVSLFEKKCQICAAVRQPEHSLHTRPAPLLMAPRKCCD